MPSDLYPSLPSCDDRGAIQVECVDSRPSDRCPASDPKAVLDPFKMLFPRIKSRVEETHAPAAMWILGSYAAALVIIAQATGQPEVVLCRRASQ